MSSFRVQSRGSGDLKTRYRPMRLEETVPTFSVERVKKIYGEGNVSQVYLFEGPTGVGKTTVARIVSRANVCEREDKPCLECEACQGMETSPDFLEINVANFRGIDAIRSLQEQVYYRPSFLKRKIFILDEVHQLTNDSQQLLLKVLEEPPEGVLFFLCTTAKGSLKRTLIDRASTVRFQSVTGEQAYELIDQVLEMEGEKNALKDTERNRIITTAEGSLRALLNGVQAFIEGDTAADWGQDDAPAGVPELAKALVAKDWPSAREVLASPNCRKSPESIRIGVSNYLRAIILKKEKATDCIPLAQPLGHMSGTLADEPAIDQYNQLVLRCLRACYKS